MEETGRHKSMNSKCLCKEGQLICSSIVEKTANSLHRNMQGSAFVKVGDVQKYINKSGRTWLLQHMDGFKHVHINMRPT